MKRTSLLLGALVASSLAFVPTASAFLTSGSATDVTTSGPPLFGPTANAVTIDAHKTDSGATPTGTVSLSATDALGTHSYTANVECLASDSINAGVLAKVVPSSRVGEPATLFGVLLHVTDNEAQGENTGEGDRVDVTTFNQAQYNRQKTAGCAPATGRNAITPESGNIIVSQGIGIIILPCPPFCPVVT